MHPLIDLLVSVTVQVQAAAPDPPPAAPPGLDAFATQILGWLKWGCWSRVSSGS